MSWVSTMSRRFLQAYTEGLTMTCPMHRAEAMGPVNPAAIDRLQDDVQARLRPEFAGTLGSTGSSTVRH